MAPKPLVQVWRAEPGKWLYDCHRCREQMFERTWHGIYHDAREHAATHIGVGFSKHR
jgi:hypothetical protein